MNPIVLFRNIFKPIRYLIVTAVSLLSTIHFPLKNTLVIALLFTKIYCNPQMPNGAEKGVQVII